jgi:2-polyprenyl-3-methyl-5-hydroxy-6-metoxy-1,4-benzoquinol methylase
MAVGSWTRRLTNNPIKRVKRYLLGLTDIHSHFRIRPVVNQVSSFLKNRHAESIKALELGCGSGMNLFELAARYPNVQAEGYDIDAPAISDAQQTADIWFPGRLKFICADVRKASSITAESYDLVLLIDVLEHIENPQEVVSEISGLLCVGGLMLISVPTPNFPNVFGRDFHRAVGHVVDGYLLEDLEDMMPEHMKLLQCKYNTGPLASWFCGIHYRRITKRADSKLVTLAKQCVRPLAVDFVNGPKSSCSLFAAFQRT